jgi:hypothetical protein
MDQFRCNPQTTSEHVLALRGTDENVLSVPAVSARLEGTEPHALQNLEKKCCELVQTFEQNVRLLADLPAKLLKGFFKLS